MMKWYDMPGALNGFEGNPSYLEKLETEMENEQVTELEIDSGSEPVTKMVSSGKVTAQIDNSWVRKHRFKKKIVRRFLSINPDMDYSKLSGRRWPSAIYLNFPCYEDERFYDPKMTYTFNPYTRIFLSPRGDLRKYHGALAPIRSSFALGRKDKEAVKLTNRRIRRHALDEEISGSYTYYKKLYGRDVEDLW